MSIVHNYSVGYREVSPRLMREGPQFLRIFFFIRVFRYIII